LVNKQPQILALLLLKTVVKQKLSAARRSPQPQEVRGSGGRDPAIFRTFQ